MAETATINGTDVAYIEQAGGSRWFSSTAASATTRSGTSRCRLSQPAPGPSP
jgi:hypothetical protein